MPPSPTMRYSPGKEARGDGHKRRHSLESGILLRGTMTILLCSMKYRLEKETIFCFSLQMTWKIHSLQG
ncbi:unnamed protein product [Lathyrus sativus]|nr:unnamed protein product [Lathyrus sativus]